MLEPAIHVALLVTFYSGWDWDLLFTAKYQLSFHLGNVPDS